MKQTEHQKLYEKRRRMLHRDERIYAQYKSKSKTFLLKWAKEEDLRAALQMIEIRLNVLKNRKKGELNNEKTLNFYERKS